MSKELIVKHNEIVEGRYNLTLTEAKIVAKLTSLIKKDDDDFQSYKFTAKELLKDLKIDENNYKDLKIAVDRLMTRIISIKTENSELKTTFLSSAEYFKNSTIELSFDKKLKPYLLQLKTNFTKYHLENILNLKSFYAIRIYELCKQYENIKERIIEISELKTILGIEKTKYKLYGHFKNKVLEIAEREINEKTDILIQIEEIKTGRKITAIKFLISAKKEIKAVENTEEIEIIEEQKEYSGAVRELFELLPEKEQIENRKNELEKLLKEHSVEMLKADIEYTKNKAKTDFWAYFLKSIKSGHFSSADLEKKKMAEEKKKLRAELEEIEKKEQEKLNEEKDKLVREKYKNLTIEEQEKYKKEFDKISENIKKIAFQNSFEVFVISKLKME